MANSPKTLTVSACPWSCSAERAGGRGGAERRALAGGGSSSSVRLGQVQWPQDVVWPARAGQEQFRLGGGHYLGEELQAVAVRIQQVEALRADMIGSELDLDAARPEGGVQFLKLLQSSVDLDRGVRQTGTSNWLLIAISRASVNSFRARAGSPLR